MTTVGISADIAWQQDKILAAQLLSISCPGRFLLDELPSMLHYWLHISTPDTSRGSDELAFALLSAVASASSARPDDVPPALFPGNDVLILQTLTDVVRRVSSIEDNTLSMQYECAKRLLPAIRDEQRYVGDISDVDQLLVPALLGSRIPLKKPHAAEVKKHILRDDDVSAIKLLSVFSMKADAHFSARLPHAFDTGAFKQRVTEMTKTLLHTQFLYSAMKRLGCIGPAVFHDDDGAETGTVDVRGLKLKRCCGKSLALLYASFMDTELETIEAEYAE